jgi:molecular chaperone GrpE
MSREKASADPEQDDQIEAPAADDPGTGEATAQDTGGEESAAETPDEVEALKSQLEEADQKAEQHWDAVLRTRAEMDNLRKRQTRELENAHKYALDKMAMELLPVRDTLEMGVAASTEEADVVKIAEGTELTLKMLTQALEKFNIVEVDPVGQKFDPDLHQAISMQEGTDKPANTVLSVMQKGYTLNDRLLRPAMVIIAK